MNQRPAQQLRIKEEFEDDEQQLLRLRSCRGNISIKREFDADNEATISRSFVCIKEEPGNDGAPCDCEDCLEEEEQEHESPRQILEPNRRLVCIKVELGGDDPPCDCSDCSSEAIKGEVVSDAEEDSPLRTRRRRVKRELDSDSESVGHYIVCIKKELNEDQQCDCTECQEEESIQNGESNSQPSTPSAFSGSDAEAMGPEETEDDDLAPMCLCRRPYQNRFSIECDCCQQWYHGDCVGVSPEQGQELEQSGQPWHCTLCTRMFIDGLEPEEIKRRVEERFANGSGRQNSSRKKKLSPTKRRKRRKIIVNLNSSSDEEGVEGHSSGSDWEEMAARQRVGQNKSRGSISAPVVQQTSSSDSEDSAESQLSSVSTSDDLNSHQPMPSTSRRSTKSVRPSATPSSSSKPFGCDDCELSFRSKKSLLIHQLVVHHGSTGSPAASHECPTCSKCFNSAKSFRRHLCLHADTGLINFKCTQCPKRFNKEQALRHHQNVIHNAVPKRYKCNQCEAKYSSKGSLVKHQESQHYHYAQRSSSKVFACKRCNIEFPNRDPLERHQFHVHGIKKWICTSCGHISPSYKGLHEHRLIHEERHLQKSYQCPECPMAFPRKWDLSVHQRCKHPTAETEQLPCPICGRIFHFKKYLKQHIVGVHRRVGRKTTDLMCVSKKHRRGDKVLFIESEESETEASESDDDDQEEETPTGRRSSRGTTTRRTTKRKG